MKATKCRKPDFLIIGAQKCGTSWLWQMLKEHPETDLPDTKEIHFFGGSEIYQKGNHWYYSHFSGLDENKITGEASTTYLFDDIPFWHNKSSDLVFDHSLPSIPDLVNRELPDVKVIAIFRNPVRRAISAYYHLMRRVAIEKYNYDHGVSPALGLEKVAKKFPKKRIIEYGFYSKYLRRWFEVVPQHRFKLFIFEEDLLGNPEKMVMETFRFLGINYQFRPAINKKVNESWSWTRIVASYYMPKIINNLSNQRIGRFLDRHDILQGKSIKQDDITFLKKIYHKEKNNMEELLGRKIGWDI